MVQLSPSLYLFLVLSVPPQRRSTAVYCSTLGHKANHKFHMPNVVYYRADHPVWGDIVGLVADREIFKHDEIFVDYGYHKQQGWDWATAVFWYKREYTNFIRRKLGLLRGRDFKQYMKLLDKN